MDLVNLVNVHIELCKENAILPTYAHDTDAGMDVYSTEDVVLNPGETKIIPIGIKVAIPEGYEIQVRPRSGVSYKTPLRISNSPGTIDAGFRDEIGVILTNTSHIESFGGYFAPYCTLESKGNIKGTYTIQKGDRVAQIVLQAVPKINWVMVDDVKTIGEDRQGGFGSTGVK